MFTLRPSFARATRRFKKQGNWLSVWQSFLAAADEAVELFPAAQVSGSAAISLPGEKERARGSIGLTALETHLTWLEAGAISQGATKSYRFHDALLADETVYVRGQYLVCGKGPKRAVIFDRHDSFDEAQLCTHPAARDFFGHWLQDAMCLELLAKSRGLTPLSFKTKKWLHEPGYRDLLMMPETSTSLAKVATLWLTDDRAFNAGWSRRFKELRSRARRKVGSEGPSRLFISRGAGGSARDLQNKDEITNLLTKHGFTIIEPEQLTAEEVIGALGNAKLIVSVEGSNLIHAQLGLPEGSAMVVIQPPRQFNAYHKVIADIVGLRFAFVVADEADGSFSVDPARLMRTIDLAEAAISNG
jgi:hypothetical protein